jgi:type I restriction enzyme R subunit
VPGPEALAREAIDVALSAAGWSVQDYSALNLHAALGVAVREFPLAPGFGFADYLLYVDGQAVGVIEAKKPGTTLSGVEPQAAQYAEGLPPSLPAPIRPLPFLYQSTGDETQFTNGLDLAPRSRRVFWFHKPETLAEWLADEPVFLPEIGGKPDPLSLRPASLRLRLQTFPPLEERGLRAAQFTAIRNLEHSLRENRPRALIQMATGSGKTIATISAIYRLIKHGDAKRILFLVDRDNLGRQAYRELQAWVTPDDGRKFTELYNVQRLASNKLDPVARVVITTIQRLYSMLKDEELPPDTEEGSLFDSLASLRKESAPVVYNPALPIEAFDFIFIDECHRSIYTVWRQVLEYFDAFLIGLTATPSKQTFGFFQQNLVMEYRHAQAVADRVNVDYDVYKLRTRISEEGSKVDAGPGVMIGKLDKATRRQRWEALDEDLVYDADALDRKVVAPDQIRTLVRAFKERVLTEIFPGRKYVPKTLIFAKDDSHAEDIVRIVREEFGKGNDFCQKITYQSHDPETVLSDFRNMPNPRVAVTVDMIATGTDVKPLEIVMFMRAVRSRNFFEQMKGRGVRTVDLTELHSVTPDAHGKDRFVLIDCVGVLEQDLSETAPLEKKPGVAFEKVLQAVAAGSVEAELISSLASRLARIDRRIGAPERAALAKLAGGRELAQLAKDLVQALDPDQHEAEARHLSNGAPPTPAQIAEAEKILLREAVKPIAANPELRKQLIEVRRQLEVAIDEISKDELTGAGFAPEIKRTHAEKLVQSFEAFLDEHKDEIDALQVLYSRPYRKRLTHAQLVDLAEKIQAPPRSWSTPMLWNAYRALHADHVRGGGGERLLTDLVSLVRFAVSDHEGELAPYRDQVEARFAAWMQQQANTGRSFDAEQRQWLEAMRDHFAGNLELSMGDLEQVPFKQMGGVGKAYRVFGGDQLGRVIDELNEVLAA